MDDMRRNPSDPLERRVQDEPLPPTPLPVSPMPSSSCGPRKRKWAAGLLAMMFPGLGHFYLGMMQRGLFFMLLFLGVICGIVFFAMEGIVPLIVLMSVLVPVVYFYSLFDGLQSTDRVNRESAYLPMAGAAPRSPAGAGHIGWALIGAGAFFFVATDKPVWFETLTDDSGSLIAAFAMIGAGLYIFWKNR